MWWAPDKGLFFKHRWLNGCLLQRVACSERQISSSNLCKHLTVWASQRLTVLCQSCGLQVLSEAQGHLHLKPWSLRKQELTGEPVTNQLLVSAAGAFGETVLGDPAPPQLLLGRSARKTVSILGGDPDASKTSQEGSHSLGLLMTVSTTALFHLNSAHLFISNFKLGNPKHSKMLFCLNQASFTLWSICPKLRVGLSEPNLGHV